MKSEVIFLWCVLFLGLVAVATAHRFRPRFCYLPAKAGNCEAAISMWYYNCATCACEKFIYGGCGGNRNRFETEWACRRRCKAKCRRLVSCDLKCKSGFVKDLKGCPICQCVDACENVKCSPREQCVSKVNPCLIPPCPESGECVDMCYLSKETGPCRGRFRRWFYNKDHCQQFIYGGCGGNKNNFPDQATCLRKCRCPRLTCDKECEYGPVFDKSGCPTCECLGNPCAFTLCQKGYQCVPIKMLAPCTGMGCPPRAKCVKAKRGRCPQYKQFGPTNVCVSDSDCPGRKKCCAVGAYYMCTSPV